MNPNLLIDQHKESIFSTYKDLHDLAEPSWKEKMTSAYIAKRLGNAGFVVQTFPHHYGLIAEIPGSSKEVVAIRADLDALVQEVDGELKAHHSCGHDAHCTMVLHAALAIASSGIKPNRTIRFIFQPAEETGKGALQMIEDGALEGVRYLFGIHVRPDFEVPYQKAAPVIMHGSAATIKGTIKGQQAHAARPQDGINAIEVAALLITKMKRIELNTEVSHSIKMTQLRVENEASNVIPETADFTIDLRSQTDEVMAELEEQFNNIAHAVMVESGAEINYQIDFFVPAATKDQEAINIVKQAIVNTLSENNLISECISHGGEDFHFYAKQAPGITATMVGLGCGMKYGLHHPKMTFQNDALIYGTKILIHAILISMNEN
ncbi:amidohydrolase [Bacillus marasmi]|uniref:amidohydrolase n=1 Tax=Bacillus marasmi TaxID=1926279 RepID=UPI0011C87DCF|nr:amidohydrolase [Bacillus marasmi]